MGGHKVKASDIDKSMRLVGRLFRLVNPYNTRFTYRFQNAMLWLFVKHRWYSLATRVKTRWAERPDGSRLRLLVCRSRKKASGPGPVTGLLWIHGGGYVCGLPEQEIGFMKLLCGDGDCIAVMPDYRRSMDAQYPAALEDCHLAFQWLYDHASELGIDGGQVFIGGDSAGGGLTAALSLYERDEGHLPIAFQMPLYPMIDDRGITESARDNDAPVWNTRSNNLAWKLYLGNLYGKDNIPCHASASRALDYSGLPPTLTYVGDIEPFYDETVAYVKALEKAGVPVHFKVYEGCFHGFDIVASGSVPAKDAKAFLRETFKYAQKHYFN